jgi:hypothetical protein
VKKLTIAKDLQLPLDAVTQTFLIVGKRGSGKSNTAARLVEQLHRARIPFVVLDPVDTWWGLKAGKDGGKGLDVYVFGGAKQDLPLEPGGGQLIAEVLCEHRVPMVLSVKHLSGKERSAFMVAFAQTLFQKWQGGPLHVVLEEAHEFAPQMAAGGRGNNNDGESAMLGAFKRLWKLGRASGIGGSAVTQRPASLSKDITTQSEILIAHRTIGPQDVAAIGQWVKYHGEREDTLAELPSLPTGQAFVWAPEFPSDAPIGLKRTSILLRETFDSAATPKVGEQRIEPKELAPVDLERLSKKMAATIERAKADDPRELKKQLAEAQRMLLRQEKTIGELQAKAPAAGPGKVIEKKVIGPKEVARLEGIAKRLEQLVDRFEPALELARNIPLTAKDLLTDIQKTAGDVRAMLTPAPAAPVVRPQSGTPSRQQAPTSRPVAPRTPTADASDTKLGKAERGILTVLAQHPEGCEKGKLTLLTGYRYSGGFQNSLGALRTSGYMVGGNQEVMRITPEGLAALGTFAPLPTGDELRQFWKNHRSFGKAERAILSALLDHPDGLDAEGICRITGYAYSGGFQNALGALRTAGVLVGKNTQVMRASSDLLEA